MTTPSTPTHRRGRITINPGCPDERDGGAFAVHISRCCENCCHRVSEEDQEADPEYVERFGMCLNVCGAADASDPDDRWCDDHQTQQEFARGLHRPETPVLLVVSGTR